MQKRVLLGVLAVGAFLGWAAFRPERLFVNMFVDDPPVGAAADSGPRAAPSSKAEATVLFTGQFHSNAHETAGVATILDVGSGRRVLRLTEFATSNGPDVRIYLVAADDVNDDAVVKTAGFVELGPMKGNRGNQNYDVPASIDLARYRTVTVWCRRFSVNFGSAPLKAS